MEEFEARHKVSRFCPSIRCGRRLGIACITLSVQVCGLPAMLVLLLLALLVLLLLLIVLLWFFFMLLRSG